MHRINQLIKFGLQWQTKERRKKTPEEVIQKIYIFQ